MENHLLKRINCNLNELGPVPIEITLKEYKTPSSKLDAVTVPSVDQELTGPI